MRRLIIVLVLFAIVAVTPGCVDGTPAEAETASATAPAEAPEGVPAESEEEEKEEGEGPLERAKRHSRMARMAWSRVNATYVVWLYERRRALGNVGQDALLNKIREELHTVAEVLEDILRESPSDPVHLYGQNTLAYTWRAMLLCKEGPREGRLEAFDEHLEKTLRKLVHNIEKFMNKTRREVRYKSP